MKNNTIIEKFDSTQLMFFPSDEICKILKIKLSAYGFRIRSIESVKNLYFFPKIILHYKQKYKFVEKIKVSFDWYWNDTNQEIVNAMVIKQGRKKWRSTVIGKMTGYKYPNYKEQLYKLLNIV